MLNRQRKYLMSIAIIGSIMMLSLKDTLNVVHTILHQIPNPFHHHHTSGQEGFYHHQNDPRQSFFSHGQHSHSLDDHIVHAKSDETKATQKNKSEKKEIEKSQKMNLFAEESNAIVFHANFYPKNKLFFYAASFFSYTHPSPPSPPPEIGA